MHGQKYARPMKKVNESIHKGDLDAMIILYHASLWPAQTDRGSLRAKGDMRLERRCEEAMSRMARRGS